MGGWVGEVGRDVRTWSFLARCCFMLIVSPTTPPLLLLLFWRNASQRLGKVRARVAGGTTPSVSLAWGGAILSWSPSKEGSFWVFWVGG